jgi:hypothetical protein
MIGEYRRRQDLWSKSNTYTVLDTRLAIAKGRLDVDNVVYLGLGSLYYFADRLRFRTFIQLAELMTIVGHLSKLLHRRRDIFSRY